MEAGTCLLPLGPEQASLSSRPSPREDSWHQLCSPKDGPRTASEVRSCFESVPSIRTASSLGISIPSPHLWFTYGAQEPGLLARTPVRLQQELALLQAWHSEPTCPDGLSYHTVLLVPGMGWAPGSLFENH